MIKKLKEEFVTIKQKLNDLFDSYKFSMYIYDHPNFDMLDDVYDVIIDDFNVVDGYVILYCNSIFGLLKYLKLNNIDYFKSCSPVNNNHDNSYIDCDNVLWVFNNLEILTNRKDSKKLELLIECGDIEMVKLFFKKYK